MSLRESDVFAPPPTPRPQRRTSAGDRESAVVRQCLQWLHLHGALACRTNIKPGWDILDNNLLACPRPHIEAVLDMLEAQPRAARFTGGIDARLCRPWFAKRLGRMRVQILYTAFDVPDARPQVERAIKMLRDEGLSQRQVGCYVLVGHDGDTMEYAEARLEWVFQTGGTPFAMFYRPADDLRFTIPPTWRSFVRKWNRPACIFASHAGAARSDATEIAPGAEAEALEEVLA